MGMDMLLPRWERKAEAGFSQKELDKRGFIYKSAYSGWYAVSDEAYYTEAQVVTTVDPATGVKSVVRPSL